MTNCQYRHAGGILNLEQSGEAATKQYSEHRIRFDRIQLRIARSYTNFRLKKRCRSRDNPNSYKAYALNRLDQSCPSTARSSAPKSCGGARFCSMLRRFKSISSQCRCHVHFTATCAS